MTNLRKIQQIENLHGISQKHRDERSEDYERESSKQRDRKSIETEKDKYKEDNGMFNMNGRQHGLF